MVALKREISKNGISQSELELLKKRVKMLNSRTTSLDHFLCMERMTKAYEGLGYKKGSSRTKSIVRMDA